MDSGLLFDASSETFGGEDLTLAVENDKVRGETSSVCEGGVNEDRATDRARRWELFP